MIYTKLIYNLGLMLGLSVSFYLIAFKYAYRTKSWQIMNGICFGAAAALVMLEPFHLLPGLIFDCRSIVLSMAGLFAGPLGGIISGLTAAAYRLWHGGVGAWTGVGTILTSAALGVGCHYLRRKKESCMRPLYFLVFGIVVHLVVLLWMFTLPGSVKWMTVGQMAVPFLTLFPIGSLVLGMLLFDVESTVLKQHCLVEKNNRWQSIHNTCDDLILSVDRDGMVVDVNNNAFDMLGYRCGEIIGLPFSKLVDSADRETAGKCLEENFTFGKTKHNPERMVRKDGVRIDVAVKSSGLKNMQGRYYQAVLIIRDVTASKTMSAALEKKDIEIRAIYAAAKNISFITTDAKDPEPRILEFSPGAENIFGFKRDEMIGKPVSLLHLPEDVKKFPEIHHMMRSGKKGIVGETRLVRKSGELFEAIFSTYPLVDKAGTMYAALGVSIDISELTSVKSALDENEKRYQQLVEYAPAGICEMDIQTGKFIEVNDVACQYLGYTKEEFLGLGIADILGESTRADILMRHRQALEGIRVPRSVECELTGKNGQTFWGLVNSRFFMVDGIVKKASVIVHDISEFKQVENALKKSREKYRALVENINDVVFSTDTEGVITYLNPVAESVFEYHPSECIGKKFGAFIHEEDLIIVETAFKNLLAGIRSLEEFRIVSKSGRIIWVRCSINTIHSNGAPTGVQGILTDITPQKTAEAEKQSLEEQLAQAQKIEAIGRLAGGVAHDFNNMLSIINGYASMALRSLNDSDPLHKDIEEILKAGQHSAALTRQLLTFARKQTVRPKVLDLNLIIKNNKKMLKRFIGEDIQQKFDLADELGRIRIDPSQIDQILINLAVNSRDAIKGVGTIFIRTLNVTLDDSFCRMHPGAEPGDYVKLSFGDTGCGMDKATKANIFDPFFTTKGKDEGTGLGLATVYGIVTQNNGYLNVYSEPGRGAVFHIYLPRVEAVDGPAVKTESRERLKGNETVLIVEDEQQILRLCTRVLEERGYAVLTANSPGEGLLVFEKQPEKIDLLITDVVMPKMNGRELYDRLIKIRPGIRVLYMSGYPANIISDRGVIPDGVNFIEKPISPDDLVRKVRDVLDR